MVTKKVSRKKVSRKKNVRRQRSNKRGGFALFSRRKPTTRTFRTRRSAFVVEPKNQPICEAARQQKVFQPEPEILPLSIPRTCDPTEFHYMKQEDPTLIKPSVEECQKSGHVLMTDPEDKGGKGYDAWIHRNNPDAICGSGYYKHDELNRLVNQSQLMQGGKRKKSRKTRKTRKTRKLRKKTFKKK